jgi:N-acetylglucosamine-6-phosphate deacetylase
MPSRDIGRHGKIIQFINCRLLRNHEIITDDLWVRDGIILNPEKLFFEENVTADEFVDCQGMLIVPGFIDVQINGKLFLDSFV